MKQEIEYIGTSEYAKYLGKTVQHVYNLIKADAVEYIVFKRGKMRGFLVKKPLEYKED